MTRFDSDSDRFFVTGTDTGVGKTVLSLLLMQFLHARGLEARYVKLIQTGCRTPDDLDSDARFIHEHVSALKGKDPGSSVVTCFQNPKAPWFAARDEGREIDIQAVREFVQERSTPGLPLILEGAGGLFVPITENLLTIDLIPLLEARPILTARTGLGTINHTLLSLEALKARDIEPFGIVLIDGGEVATPKEMIRENIEAVERFSGIRVAGVIDKIEDLSRPPGECFQPLLKMFSDQRPGAQYPAKSMPWPAPSWD
ncbi:MAG TPA: dethiobiotin synthase [Syntrophobacteraceae bacterium]|nr:dethiobiotin synthase [Syntrophobacteraceae bacterium]